MFDSSNRMFPILVLIFYLTPIYGQVTTMSLTTIADQDCNATTQDFSNLQLNRVKCVAKIISVEPTCTFFKSDTTRDICECCDGLISSPGTTVLGGGMASSKLFLHGETKKLFFFRQPCSQGLQLQCQADLILLSVALTTALLYHNCLWDHTQHGGGQAMELTRSRPGLQLISEV